MTTTSPKPCLGATRPRQMWTVQQILASTQPNEAGCLVWTGPTNTARYGYLWHNMGHWLTHRLAWTLQRGEIPDDLQIDHLCRNRACQNVEHMELVTLAENNRRRSVHNILIDRGNACPQGHAYTPENSMRNGKAQKLQCRTCDRERGRIYRAKKKASAS